jgi:hypothetical protein
MQDKRPEGPGEAEEGEAAALARIATRIEDMRAEIAAIRDRVELFGRALQIREAAETLRASRPGIPAAPSPAAAPVARPDPGTAGLPARFEAEAAEMLRMADGFHALEWGRAGAFRWTGPGHDARFEAFLDRSAPLKATLSLLQIGDPANEEALQLLVDGTAHALKRDTRSNAYFAGPIAPRERGGPTEIRLRVPYLHWPARTGGLDKRTLGVCFQRLVIEPA